MSLAGSMFLVFTHFFSPISQPKFFVASMGRLLRTIIKKNVQSRGIISLENK